MTELQDTQQVTPNKQILIVTNNPSPSCTKLRQAIHQGALEYAEETDIVLLEPQQFTAEQVRNADAVIIGTTENFGYMSGIIKDFFERIYNHCLDCTEGKPVALYIKAGNDGSGALNSVLPILTGLKWRLISDPIICKGQLTTEFMEQCRELGATMTAGIEADIF